jgi:hypothetical protein
MTPVTITGPVTTADLTKLNASRGTEPIAFTVTAVSADVEPHALLVTVNTPHPLTGIDLTMINTALASGAPELIIDSGTDPDREAFEAWLENGCRFPTPPEATPGDSGTGPGL